MTIATEVTKAIATGNGVATQFPFTFTVAEAEELTVYLQEISSGAVTGPLSDALYSVTLSEDGTGYVTYPLVGSPLAATHKIAVVRAGTVLQGLDILNQDGFLPEAIEAALDDLVRRVQEVKEVTNRALTVDVFSTPVDVDDIIALLDDLDATAAQVASDAATASTAAANASLAESGAEEAAGQALASVAGILYAYATATGDADPGAGVFRLNNAAPASATALYIDNVDALGVTQSGAIDRWDDSNNTTDKGTVKICSAVNPAVQHIYRVTGSVLDGSGYRKVTLTWLAGAGSFTAAEEHVLTFSMTGNKGTDGVGAGDVVGPASSTDSGFAKFDGTTGKLLKNSAATIGTSDIANDAVTPAKLDNGVAVSVLGRSANSSGDRADIAAAANDRLLARTSDAVGFVQLTIGMIPDALITFAKMATGAIATTGELLAGTASKILTAEVLKNAIAYQTLTDAATVAWNMALGNNALVVLGGNRTLGNPTNAIPLFGFVLKVTATGSTRTLALGANWVKGSLVESFPIQVLTSETVFVHGFVDTTSRFVITGVTRT